MAHTDMEEGVQHVRFDIIFPDDDSKSGYIVFEVHSDWAPLGSERFMDLVEAGFFTKCRFFRVVENFVAQFGISGDPTATGQWPKIRDDPQTSKASNTRGFLTFATSGKYTRTTQLFINFGNNAFLDSMGFVPLAHIIEGEDLLNRIYAGYGEGAPKGNGPSQQKIQDEGNAYLAARFPLLSYIERAYTVPAPTPFTQRRREWPRKSILTDVAATIVAGAADTVVLSADAHEHVDTPGDSHNSLVAVVLLLAIVAVLCVVIPRPRAAAAANVKVKQRFRRFGSWHGTKTPD